HRAGTAMTDDNRICAHGIESDRCINQGFALFNTRLRGVHINDIRPHPLAGNLERKQRARAVLEKGVDNGQAIESTGMFDRFAVKLDPLLGLLQEKQYLPRLQACYAQKMAMWKSVRSRRKLMSGGGW